MKIRFKKNILLSICALLLIAGLAVGIWYYRAHVLPLRPVQPVLKVLKLKKLPNALRDSNRLVWDHLIYPNASNDLFTGYAAQSVRQEFLKVLRTTEDANCRYNLLWIVFATGAPEESRIQFEGEDWDVIKEAANRANLEAAEFMKNAGRNPRRIDRWVVNQREGRMELGLEFPGQP